MFVSVLVVNFRLLAALRLHPTAKHGPAVLAEVEGHRSAVMELNVLAQRFNILPGMEIPKALARCRELVVLNRSEQAERAATKIMWSHGWNLSPRIELTQPGVMTLEVPGERESWEGHMEKLLRGLQANGLFAQAGIAPTAEWAYYAALSAEKNRWRTVLTYPQALALLDYLPVGAVIENKWACGILKEWGILNAGAVAQLPRQALGERLGPTFLKVWDELNGHASRPLQVDALEPEFLERHDFEDPVNSLEPVLFLIRRLLETLEGQLSVVCQVARSVEIGLEVVDGSDYHKWIHLPEPTRDAALLHRLLQHHLEQVRVEGMLSGFFVRLEPVEALGKQGGLFEKSLHNPWRLRETLDQLAGLVGAEHMGSPRSNDTHGEDDYRLEALAEELAPWEQKEGPSRMGLMLHRYRPKLMVTVLCSRERPLAIESNWVEGPIVDCRGPYVSSGKWWTLKRWSVEEWDIEVEDVGVFRLQREGERWYLVGAYD